MGGGVGNRGERDTGKQENKKFSNPLVVFLLKWGGLISQIAKVSFVLTLYDSVRTFESKEKWKSTTELFFGNSYVSCCKKKSDSYRGESSIK